MKHRRIANYGFTAVITIGCAIMVWTAVLQFHPRQRQIELDTNLRQRPSKRRAVSIVGKEYISYEELYSECVRIPECCKRGD